LAAQTGIRLQTPRPVEQVFLCFFGFVQAVQSLSHNDVTRGASATHVTGMLNVDFVVEQGFANAGACRRRNLSAFGAVFSVRQYFDNWHGVLC
jgi:hypothetical protein